jgi:hypothetical protein
MTMNIDKALLEEVVEAHPGIARSRLAGCKMRSD